MKQLLLLTGFVLCCTFAFAQPPKDTAYIRDHYTKMEKYIPMRDGKTCLLLFTCPKINQKNTLS
ncbi:hypothetical protein [Mucilaginibacter flavidus]|uniref:hypothetical protein n=1 Tax=Mucilaginibacter flavidus TaxID=2949309 RepID=UPI003515E846